MEDRGGYYPAQVAIMEGNLEMAQLLFETIDHSKYLYLGAGVENILQTAIKARKRKFDSILFLVEEMKVDVRNHNLLRLLSWQNEKETDLIEIAKYLMKKGAGLDEFEEFIAAPVVVALSNSNYLLGKLFIENGCKLGVNQYPNVVTATLLNSRKRAMDFEICIKDYIILKGMDQFFEPYSNIELSSINISDWKNVFISAINYSPFPSH